DDEIISRAAPSGAERQIDAGIETVVGRASIGRDVAAPGRRIAADLVIDNAVAAIGGAHLGRGRGAGKADAQHERLGGSLLRGSLLDGRGTGADRFRRQRDCHDRFAVSQEQAVAWPPAEKPDPSVGLADIGLEEERKSGSPRKTRRWEPG